ncbi:hypothetical protein, partial [Klebsiella pneumoniae]|uniref:hypothetical protein n=1 Tax=Klebsiella pneumoniae TaxID=573 RepID=UPI00272FC38D
RPWPSSRSRCSTIPPRITRLLPKTCSSARWAWSARLIDGNVNQSTLITGNLNAITNLTQINVVMGNNNLNNITRSLNLDQLKGL